MSPDNFERFFASTNEAAKHHLIMRGSLHRDSHSGDTTFLFRAYRHWSNSVNPDSLITLKALFKANSHGIGLPDKDANPELTVEPYYKFREKVAEWPKGWQQNRTTIFIQEESDDVFMHLPETSLSVFIPLITITACLRRLPTNTPSADTAQDLMDDMMQQFLRESRKFIRHIIDVL